MITSESCIGTARELAKVSKELKYLYAKTAKFIFGSFRSYGALRGGYFSARGIKLFARGECEINRTFSRLSVHQNECQSAVGYLYQEIVASISRRANLALPERRHAQSRANYRTLSSSTRVRTRRNRETAKRRTRSSLKAEFAPSVK